MSQFPYQQPTQRTQPLDYAGPSADTLAIGRFFNAVYAWMAVGLAVTALVAWFTAQYVLQNPRAGFLGNGTFIILFVAEIALVWVISSAINKISASVATVLFLLYSALNGITLSVLLLVYANSVIFNAFLSTAVMFGVMSVYGFVTKNDLTTVGRIAFMGLIGVIVASVVNIFFHSSGLQIIIAYIGVLVFVALTAYDTQRLKAIANQTQGNHALAARMSIVGSLMLYLDFINLFILLVEILGNRRN